MFLDILTEFDREDFMHRLAAKLRDARGRGPRLVHAHEPPDCRPALRRPAAPALLRPWITHEFTISETVAPPPFSDIVNS